MPRAGSMRMTALYLPEEVRAAVRALARASGDSEAAHYRAAVREYLTRQARAMGTTVRRLQEQGATGEGGEVD